MHQLIAVFRAPADLPDPWAASRAWVIDEFAPIARTAVVVGRINAEIGRRELATFGYDVDSGVLIPVGVERLQVHDSDGVVRFVTITAPTDALVEVLHALADDFGWRTFDARTGTELLPPE